VDEEISRYVEREPERVAKKDAWRARQQRARERRVAMFLALRDVGVVPAFNSTMAALRQLMEEHGVTLDVTRDSERDPRSNPQPTTNIRTTYVDVTRDVTTHAEQPEEPPIAPTRAGQACRAMRAAGMPDVNPSHPQLLRLLKAGVTDDELRMAAATAVAKHKPFAYALAIVEGQRNDAASAGPVAARQSAQTDVVEAWVPALASRRPGGLP
jgi:8-oxo-dGTP pyrophosphatase MutT (NUDIX family)